MFVRSLHRWVGLLLCVLLAIISITGVLLAWKPEYLRATVAGADQPIVKDIRGIARAVDSIIESHPAKTVSLIQIYPHELSVHKVRLSGKRYAWYSQSGELVQLWASNERIEDWLLDLHHRFLLGNTIGLNMAGFSGILLVPLVLIGLWLWWPNRNNSAFKLLPQGSRPGQLLRSHRNFGVISSVPILFVAISGVILVYPAESARVLLCDTTKQPKPHVRPISSDIAYPGTAEKLEYVLSVFPGARIRLVRPPSEYSDRFLVGVQQLQGLNRLGHTHISFENHRPVEVRNALQQSASKRMFDFVFPLHTGLLPLWYRLLLTLFGVALLLVSSLGVIAYLKKRK